MLSAELKIYVGIVEVRRGHMDWMSVGISGSFVSTSREVLHRTEVMSTSELVQVEPVPSGRGTTARWSPPHAHRLLGVTRGGSVSQEAGVDPLPQAFSGLPLFMEARPACPVTPPGRLT